MKKSKIVGARKLTPKLLVKIGKHENTGSVVAIRGRVWLIEFVDGETYAFDSRSRKELNGKGSVTDMCGWGGN